MMMIFMKQPSILLRASPGSPHPSSHSTVMKMGNSSPAGSSSPRTRSGSSISTVPTLAMQDRLQRHCFRDDLWIEEEKKRQRRLTREAPKRGAYPLEELDEVSVTKMSSSGAKPLFASFSSLLSVFPLEKKKKKTSCILVHLLSSVLFDLFRLSTISPLLLSFTLDNLFCTLLAACIIGLHLASRSAPLCLLQIKSLEWVVLFIHQAKILQILT